ncbi:hypothetical protein [Actinopolymorpha sp. B9G3]|uniref:hypothetical protein n=1 Tax=Actinopolymorpha sp. B9G3 TaxID=3158970 RepID=UPI0032D8E561
MVEPLRPGDPTLLGPFRVHGRLAARDAGVVLVGYDPAGRAVALTVLHTAAAADPAARDRLVSAVERLAAQSPEAIVAGAPHETVPWVATAYAPGTHPTAGLALLGAAGLGDEASTTTAGLGTAVGPDFAPHWAGSPAATTITPSGTPGGANPVIQQTGSSHSLLVVAACILAACAVIGGGGFLARALVDSGDDVAGPRAPQAGQTEPLPAPSESPPDGDSTSPQDPLSPSSSPRSHIPDGPAGPVAGPTFGKDEPTYLMDLRGFSFDFRVPKSWGCLRSSKAGPDAVRWICVDESYAFSGHPGDPPGGIVEVQRCRPRCDGAQWGKIRDQLPELSANWRRTDDTTMYVEWTVGSGATARTSVALSHVFAEAGRGHADTHVAVRLAGTPDQKRTLQKIVNDIRTQTP